MEIPLKYQYKLNSNNKIIIPNPYSIIDTPFNFDDKSKYNLNDTQNYLLENFGNILDDTIYFSNFLEFKKAVTDPKLEITKFLWPLTNYEDNLEQLELYKSIIDDYNNIYEEFDIEHRKIHLSKIAEKTPKLLTNFSKVYPNIPEKLYKFSNCTYSNIVFHVNENSQTSMDIFNIFDKLELSLSVPYIKIRDSSKAQKYKIFKSLITNDLQKTIHKRVGNFNDIYKYITKYDKNRYKSFISQKNLETWQDNKILVREKNYIKYNQGFNKTYLSTLVPELLIKYLKPNHQMLTETEKYGTIILHQNGFIEIKIYNDGKYIDYSDVIDNLKVVKSIIKKINKIDTSESFMEPNISMNNKLISFNINLSIKLPNNLKLSKLQSVFNKFYQFCYSTASNDSKKQLIIKYKAIKNIEHFDSIKSYFFKLKKSTLDLDVKKFNTLWINSAKKVFNLSELDATNILDIISETLDTLDLKPNLFELETTIEINKLSSLIDSDDSMDTYEISIINCNNIAELHNIYK